MKDFDSFMKSMALHRTGHVQRALSLAIIEGEMVLEDLPTLSESEIRNQLTHLKGIGNWTADIYLMFCLQSKDIFPVGDIAVINAAMELAMLNSKEEVVSLSDNR